MFFATPTKAESHTIDFYNAVNNVVLLFFKKTFLLLCIAFSLWIVSHYSSACVDLYKFIYTFVIIYTFCANFSFSLCLLQLSITFDTLNPQFNFVFSKKHRPCHFSFTQSFVSPSTFSCEVRASIKLCSSHLHRSR